MNVDPLPTQTRLEDRRSVLGNASNAKQDSGHDSTVLAHDLRMRVIAHGGDQTGQAWTAVDHVKRRRYQHRSLEKKILVARTRKGAN
jgi:hypothetical protein